MTRNPTHWPDGPLTSSGGYPIPSRNARREGTAAYLGKEAIITRKAMTYVVTPAKAGVQESLNAKPWIPVFTGMTTKANAQRAIMALIVKLTLADYGFFNFYGSFFL